MLITVSLTICVPAVVKVKEGFFSLDEPSPPKSQNHCVGEPADLSTNKTVIGIVPDSDDAVKAALSPTLFTVMLSLEIVVPLTFLAVRFAV